LANQTEVQMGILGPGSFMLPSDYTCELCKKSSSFNETLEMKLAAGESTSFTIESHCRKCDHVFLNPCLR
jgi:hypothetical protein